MSNRVKYMDIAKALGIILVVYGHSGAPFWKFVYLFHMSLFFFVSGYFYQDKYTSNPVRLVVKRIKTLYIPFIKYGIIFTILHNLFFNINFYSELNMWQDSSVHYFNSYIDFIKNIIGVLSFAKIEQLLAPFWFLPVLFCVNILFVGLSYLVQKINITNYIRPILIISLFIMGVVISPQNKVLKLMSISLIELLLYYAGYLFKKYGKLFIFKSYVALGCFAILSICLNFGSINVAAHQIVNPLFFILCSLSGIYICLYLSTKITGVIDENNILYYIGKNTIIILALQFISFKTINYLQIIIFKYPTSYLAKPVISNSAWWVLYAFVGIFIPLFIQKFVVDNINKFIQLNIYKKKAKVALNEQ